MSQLSREEVEAHTTAIRLIVLAKEAEETGMDKLLYFYTDEIPQRDYPLIDRFLRELGANLRLGDQEVLAPEPASIRASVSDCQCANPGCSGGEQ